MFVVVVVEQQFDCDDEQLALRKAGLELEQTLAEFGTAGRGVEMAVVVAVAALPFAFACVVAVMWCGGVAATTLGASVAVEVVVVADVYVAP